jgi:UDP:flavonoid glycosyltransferase YjiC (YdhE family)
VLSKASLFLTRSGINSVNEALYYGVPMLLFPGIMEQKLVAAQVSSAGAGVILDERKIGVEDLRTHVQDVLRQPISTASARRDAPAWGISDRLLARGPYDRKDYFFGSNRSAAELMQ